MSVEYLQIVSVPVSSQDQAREFFVRGLGWDLLSDEEYELGAGNSEAASSRRAGSPAPRPGT
jgi:hypothetical protein